MQSFLKQALIMGLIVLIPILVGYSSVLFFGPHNQVEIVAQEVINHQTGIDIDFSPEADEH